MSRAKARDLLRWSIGRWTRSMLAAATVGDHCFEVTPSLRDRVLWKAMEADRGWPYPPVVNMPDLAALRPPMVLATAHVGSLLVLGALLERLPADVLVMHASYPARPGLTMYSVAGASELERAGAFRRAIIALRAGGFVLIASDGAGQRRVQAELLGRTVPLAAGPFSLARAARVPILPVAGYWRGRMIELAVGAAIPPAREEDMAAEFGSWLEQILRHHPRDVGSTLEFVLRSPSADALD